jgi:hypothetical protein
LSEEAERAQGHVTQTRVEHHALDRGDLLAREPAGHRAGTGGPVVEAADLGRAVPGVMAGRRHADDSEDQHQGKYWVGAGDRAQQAGLVVTCRKSLTSPDTRDDYTLMKSVGVVTMHAIAPSVFEAARAVGGKVTQEALKDVLADAAKNLDDDFWHSSTGQAGRVGTNNKAVRLLSDQVLKHLRSDQFSGAIL